MKTKSLTKPIFLLLLMLGALWWSGCGRDCGCLSNTKGKFIESSLDTQYFEIVKQFSGQGKEYSYSWIQNSDTTFITMRLDSFEFKYELDRVENGDSDCDYPTKCDTIMKTYYQSDIFSDNNIYIGNYSAWGHAMQFNLINKELDRPYPEINEGFRFLDNLKQLDTTSIYRDKIYTFKWHKDYFLNGTNYNGITEYIIIDREKGDTISFEAYNNNIGILKYKKNDGNEIQQIELLEIK